MQGFSKEDKEIVLHDLRQVLKNEKHLSNTEIDRLIILSGLHKMLNDDSLFVGHCTIHKLANLVFSSQSKPM